MKKCTSILCIIVLSLIFNHTVIARNDVTDNISNPKIPVLQESASLYPAAILDTLRWIENGNTNFGGWSGDYFATYFAFPAEGILHSIILPFSDLPDTTGGSFTLWICDNHYPWPDFDPAEICDGATAWLGYFCANDGYSAFGKDNQWQRGLINSIADSAKIYNPLGNILWPDSNGITIEIDPDITDIRTFQIHLKDYSESSLYFLNGDTLFILIRFNGFEDKKNDSKYRFGCFSGIHPVEYPFLKFYNNTGTPSGRMGNEDFGWYIRSYTPSWACAVEYASGPPPFFIRDVTVLTTTLSTEPRDVFARVYPCSGLISYDSLLLYYSTDHQVFEHVRMDTVTGEEYYYKGTIPGFDPGTEITYYVKGYQYSGIQVTSMPISYSIFQATKPTLFIYDANEMNVEIADHYYFTGAWDTDAFAHDIWAGSYGPPSIELLNNYNFVIHVMGGGPANQNYSPGEVYKPWLDEANTDNPRYLFISGQDYGFISGYADTSFPAGTFEHDYLGIETLGPQDINYDSSVASYQNPYRIDPVQGDTLSGNLYRFQGDSVVLFYAPYEEIRFNNWIDNLTPVAGAHVPFTDPNNDNAAVAVYNEGANWKCVFYAFDILSLDFRSPLDSSSSYQWILNVENCLTPILNWWGEPIVSIDRETILPKDFALKQNYPNPFNPTTIISFELPKETYTEINIYNLAGQLVQTLLNEVKPAGRHQIIWDAGDLPSGIYFYQIKVVDTTGNRIQTKKCILLK